MDGNNGMFPLAIFVCRKEDGENWDAFLELLAPELKKHHLPLTIMSDRAPSLVAAIEKHLGGCEQRFCFRHIFKNMCKWWRGSLIQYQSWVTAEVYTSHEFEKSIDELESVVVGVKDYLMEIGPSMWSRSHFGLSSKCNHLTNNFTESFNSFIIETRDKPICSMVTGISFLIMKIMYDRRIKSLKWEENDVVPRVKSIIAEYISMENEFLTQPVGDTDYCVVHHSGSYHTVNIEARECTCREWQLTGIPCVHGVFVINSFLRTEPIDYCHDFLKVKAYRACYEGNIMPVPHEDTWPKGSETVEPPVVTRSAGRPKTNRYKGADELENHEKQNAHKCGKCGAFGHNKRSCQGGPVRGGTNARKGRPGRPPKNGGRTTAKSGETSAASSRGGRAVRGTRGRGTRGRGAGGRGESSHGSNTTTRSGTSRNMNAATSGNERPTTIQVPTARGPIQIQLPPPPPTRITAIAGPSKKRKTFHPPGKAFMP